RTWFCRHPAGRLVGQPSADRRCARGRAASMAFGRARAGTAFAQRSCNTPARAPQMKPGEADPRIHCSAEGGVARLRIDRPEARNALDSSMLHALIVAIDSLARDDSVQVVVFESAGDAFCAGFDLAELEAADDAARRAAFILFNRFARRLQRLPQAVIARVQGVATAGGCQIVAACDLAVASSDARFATSSIGL